MRPTHHIFLQCCITFEGTRNSKRYGVCNVPLEVILVAAKKTQIIFFLEMSKLKMIDCLPTLNLNALCNGM